MNEDFQQLLEALLAAQARFLVVGAHALAVHGVPRATGDLDIWVDRESQNADRVWSALAQFGAPVAELGVRRDDLTLSDMVIQIGIPPRRIDLLTGLSGVQFEAAWAERVVQEVGVLAVPFLGRRELIANKRVTGRLKDLADLESLGES